MAERFSWRKQEELPDLNEYDNIFRNLKVLADTLMNLDPVSSEKFVKTAEKMDNKPCIFVQYLNNRLNAPQ